MIQIQFKAKHCYWIASLLTDINAEESHPILKRMGVAVAGVESDDTLVTVEATAAELIRVYPILSGQAEGLAAKINDDMDTLLASQVGAGVSANNSDWIQIAEFITVTKQGRATELAAKIEGGKALLNA